MIEMTARLGSCGDRDDGEVGKLRGDSTTKTNNEETSNGVSRCNAQA
jgi:hypothetical protein